MLLKNIKYWNGKKWIPSNIKTDTLHIETENHFIDIVTDREVRKVEISSKKHKNIKGRNMRTFTSFID